MAVKTHKEEEYARQYKLTGDKKYKELAVNEMRDMIFSTVRSMNLSAGLDTRALYQQGLGRALEAVETWEPGKSKLTTHTVNQLKPILRTVYSTSPILHVPEHTIKDFGKFKNAYSEYVNEYGDMNPDPIVLSDMTGFSKKKIEEFLKRERLVHNDSTVTFAQPLGLRSDHRMDPEYLRAEFDNDPLKKKIWKHIEKALSKDDVTPNAREIHRKIGGSYYEVNKAYGEIVETLNNYMLTIS